jgi:FkbM family methyltransferase
MKHFLDLGAHKLEGLMEFTEKLGIDKNWLVYSYEPNINVYEEAKKNAEKIKNNYYFFELYKKAVLDKNGIIKFNSHRGAWKDRTKSQFMSEYTMGANALDINPISDIANGVIFDSILSEVECVNVDDILMSICNNDLEAEIYIKCDIEGSEFIVIPKMIQSNYVSHIKEIYVEWHERMWFHEGDVEMINKRKEKETYIFKLKKLGIKYFDHH